MALPLPPEQQAKYSNIIDQILATSDINTISAKRIRRGLQDELGVDITAQKQEITELIMNRFDKFQRDHENEAAASVVADQAPSTNGIHNGTDGSPNVAQKRKVEDTDDRDGLSVSPPKKSKREIAQETDEQMAKRMQAELNQQASRATRGGGVKKKYPAKKEKKPKKKSAAKIRSDEDSELNESGTEKPEKERKGGFHKPMNLSEPLQALLGESQLSRPQTVKRIWAYVKERDLQQPDDKRNILCDEKLRAVFKSDKVHMFTMNKILATQLYPADE